jgi:large subunit ribosomal protein L16
MAKGKKVGFINTPPKAKFKRYHKFIAKRSTRFSYSPESFGNVALKSIANGRITVPELEACKKFIKRSIKKKASLFVRVYPYLPLTKKPGETRMGKGKSSRVSGWVCPIHCGKILFEISGLRLSSAIYLLSQIQTKISLDTKISVLQR